jgi:hypothetical protein
LTLSSDGDCGKRRRIGLLLGGPLLALALMIVPTWGEAAAAIPSVPPVSQTDGQFALEPAGSLPVDNDGRIPSPSTPPAPVCTTTLTAPSSGSVVAVQARIDADVAAGASFTGDTICLSGTFRAPLHVRGKFSTAELTIARAPGTSATFDLTGRPVQVGDEDPNAHDNTDVGAIEVGDSRDVEIYGLTIENWATSSAAFAPAGIYVTTRSDSGGTGSPCYTRSSDHVCGDIFLYDNTVRAIANNAAGCGNPNINAYGIAVKGFGQDAAHALQHVVVEGNTVTRTVTGQSETVTINGDLTDFLVADNTIADVNNIGIDAIGWETSITTASQARDGLISSNHVSNVDTRLNFAGYGRLVGGKCLSGDDSAGGLYVDGASYVWLDRNTVTNTNHGIELGAENPGGSPNEIADHLLVTRNVVSDTPGTGFGTVSSPSYAGHAYAAFMVGGINGANVVDVYAHENSFTNQSQFYTDGASNPPVANTASVVNVDNHWQNVWMLGNTVAGGGAADKLNPVLMVNTSAIGSPKVAPGVVVDCNRYNGLSTTPTAATADNFDTPAMNTPGWGLFSYYRTLNHLPTAETGVTGWDANSATGGTPTCPFALPN